MHTKTLLSLIIIGWLSMNTALAIDTDKNNLIIKLPKPTINKDFSLDQAIAKRRSVRNFKKTNLTTEQISNLLWAAHGITDSKKGLRTTPSAGALYPLQIYLVKNDGAWVYLPRKHALEEINNQDIRTALFNACLRQKAVKSAPISIVITADYNVIAKKYGNDRAPRYTHIEVGHAAQNILLEATALGLAGVTIGAFNDTAIKKLLNLPENRVALLVIPIGEKAKSKSSCFVCSAR